MPKSLRDGRRTSLVRQVALGCVATTLALSSQGQTPARPAPAAPASAPAPARPVAAPAAAATGTVTGRVYNPLTKEYVKDAEVSIRGTDRVVFSESDGTYQFSDVPAGPVTLEVRYTGYDMAIADVTVGGGQTATRDFDLTSAAYKAQAKPGEDIIQLGEFVVSSEREGNAKAIQDQKRSMNISNIVASDIFGDVAEGNVGEFLKYMPGVDLEYVEADTRTPRLRGMDAQYVGVSMDGLKMASADAFAEYNGSDNSGGAGMGSRSFSFEQVSINSVDTIEVNFTTGADMDADAPAGTINMRSKRAFDRKGRQITAQVNVMANGEDLTYKNSYGPDDNKNYKLRPGGIFEYSDVFLNNRLGIVLNLSESNMYNQQRQTGFTWNATTTPTDTRPLVLTQMAFKNGPKFTERSAATLTVDFKATSRLTLGLNMVGNYYFGTINNRTTTFGGWTRATVVGNGMTDFSTTSTATTGSVFLRKKGNGLNIVPRFEYKLKNLTVDGAFSYSRSVNSYENALGDGVARDTQLGTGGVSPTGVVINVTRSDTDAVDFRITQTAGQDWGDLANYRAGSNATTGMLRVLDEGRYARDDIYQAAINARYMTGWKLPTWFKVGAKVTEGYHFRENRTPWYVYGWAARGPNATYADMPSQHIFDMGHGTSFSSITGRAPAFADRTQVANYFLTHRDEFVGVGSAANYASAFFENHRDVRERFDAAYVQGGTKIRKLQVQAGVRLERTTTEARQFDPLTNQEIFNLPGNPYNITTTAVPANPTTGTPAFTRYNDPTTVDGMRAKYLTRGIKVDENDYTKAFPSISAKYTLKPNVQLQVGYSRAMRRPSYRDVGGVVDFNDAATPLPTVEIPNPDLDPEISDNISARLAYYFEPVGSLAIGGFENSIKDHIFETADNTTYPGYEGTRRFNAPGTNKFRGYMIEYGQSLSFLPKPLSGMSVFANYTRNYYQPSPELVAMIGSAADARTEKPGMAPHLFAAGVSYKLRALRVGVNAKWTDVTPYSSNRDRWRKQRTMVDMNANYQLTRNFGLFIQGRNIFNVPDYIYDTEVQQRIRFIEYYGAIWTAGVKATF